MNKYYKPCSRILSRYCFPLSVGCHVGFLIWKEKTKKIQYEDICFHKQAATVYFSRSWNHLSYETLLLSEFFTKTTNHNCLQRSEEEIVQFSHFQLVSLSPQNLHRQHSLVLLLPLLYDCSSTEKEKEIKLWKMISD